MLLPVLRRFDLYDSLPDSDGLYNGYIVPLQHANLMFKLGYLSLLTTSFAVYKQYYLHSLIPMSVGLSTFLYWIKPTYGVRRYVDMAVVSSGLMYNFYHIRFSEHIVWFYIVKTLAVLSYLMGWYYHRQGYISYGTFFHCGIHVFGQIGNIILYLS